MFSGIVEDMARVRDVNDLETMRQFRVEAPHLSGELDMGDSIAVDGVCLTVTDLHSDGFSVDVIGTTLERTIAESYADGSRINLERALQIGYRLGGHLVQGHVDGVGHLIKSISNGEFWTMDFSLPLEVFRETVDHGSITLNGVSLTVSELLPESGVRIAVTPYTHEHTNLGELRPGSAVNVEGDLIGKYVGRIFAQRES